MRSSRLTGLVLAAIVAVGAGCGDDDDANKAGTSTGTQATTPAPTPTTQTTETAPSKKGKADPVPGQTVQAFYNKVSQRDGDAACGHLKPELQQTAISLIRKTPGGGSVTTCGEALEAGVRRSTAAQLRTLRDVKILSSTAVGGLATVRVQRAVRDVLLTKDGSRWLISAGLFRSA